MSIINGTTIDSATRLPLQGATVYAIQAENLYKTTTNVNGQYMLTVPPAVYSVLAYASGYIRSEPTIDVSVEGTYIQDFALSPIPTSIGGLEVHTYEGPVEVVASVEIVGIGTYTTPLVRTLILGVFTLNTTYKTYPAQTKTVDIISQQTTKVDFQFAPTLDFALLLGIVIVGGIAYFLTRKT